MGSGSTIGTMSRLAFAPLLVLALSLGCGESTPAPDTGTGTDAATDAGGDAASDASGDSGGDSGTSCVPVTCEVACPFGFARGADGCEFCECAEERINSCASPADCTLATEPDCCSCQQGYAAAVVDREPCLVREGEDIPPGCLPDPEICALVDCVPCESSVSVDCVEGLCVGSP